MLNEKSVFIEKEILKVNEKKLNSFGGVYRVLTKLEHVFLMISHSASPRARSSKKRVLTYTYRFKINFSLSHRPGIG